MYACRIQISCRRAAPQQVTRVWKLKSECAYVPPHIALHTKCKRTHTHIRGRACPPPPRAHTTMHTYTHAHMHVKLCHVKTAMCMCTCTSSLYTYPPLRTSMIQQPSAATRPISMMIQQPSAATRPICMPDTSSCSHSMNNRCTHEMRIQAGTPRVKSPQSGMGDATFS